MKRVLLSCFVCFSVLTLVAGLALSAEREADSRSAKATTVKAAPQESKTTAKSSTPTVTQTTANIPQAEVSQNPIATGVEMTGEQINWYVISSGATSAASTNFQLQGTIGQLAVGDASSTNYTVKSGYWQDFGSGSGGCCVLRGNVNDIGDIDIADLTYLVGFMFKGGPPPPCYEQGNVNAVGDIDISDLTYLVSFMFKGGPAPPAC